MSASRIHATACSLLFLLGATNLAWADKPVPASTSSYPSARYGHSMASNGASATSRIYMFGGNAGLPSTAFLNDLWYYSASSGLWTPLTPTGRSWPQLGRGYGALSCGGGKCVLFTGTSGTKDLNETWVFAEPVGTATAVAWTQVACSKPGACPAARIVPLMAFDPTRNYHVSFGGSHDTTTTFGDTWTFNGSKWTLRSASSKPAVRSQGSAAFVPTHVWNGTSVVMNKVVIFGGNPYPNTPYPAALCSMYSWNGSAWEEISTNQGPCLIGATMAWDTPPLPGNPRLMVAGGFKDALDTINTETWYFTFSSSTSGTWTQASGSGCAPLMRAIGGYDVPSKKLVFFGGSAGNTGYAYGDTLVCP